MTERRIDGGWMQGPGPYGAAWCVTGEHPVDDGQPFRLVRARARGSQDRPAWYPDPGSEVSVVVCADHDPAETEVCEGMAI